MNITALLAGLFSGIAGAMSLGGGAVLIIFLNIFTDYSQLEAGGINLLFFVPIALVAVLIYAKHGEIEFKKVWKLALGGLLGSVVGITLATVMGGEILTKVFGGLLAILGAKELLSK